MNLKLSTAATVPITSASSSSEVTKIKSDESRSSRQKITFWQDKVTAGEKNRIDKLLANFIIRCALPFRVVDANSFRALLLALRLGYKPPCAKTVATKLLNNVYDDLKRQLRAKIDAADSFVLISDGWTNVAKHHLVNFIIILPNEKPFFWKCVDTSTLKNDANTSAETIIAVAKELNIEKWVGLVTDNAPVMQKVWDIIEARYPNVFCNGCLAHGLNLFNKNICSLSDIIILFQKSNKIVRMINDHMRLFHIYKEEIAPLFGVTSGLTNVMETRFYTHYTHGLSVLKNKAALRHLVEDRSELLNEYSSDTVAAFKRIVNDTKFWDDLKFVVNCILQPAREAIGLFESDSVSIEVGYG